MPNESIVVNCYSTSKASWILDRWHNSNIWLSYRELNRYTICSYVVWYIILSLSKYLLSSTSHPSCIQAHAAFFSISLSAVLPGFSVSALVRFLLRTNHWNIGRVTQEMEIQTIKMPKERPTILCYQQGTSGVNQTGHTSVLCAKNNCAHGTRNVVEWCCMPIVENLRQNFYGKDANGDVG